MARPRDKVKRNVVALCSVPTGQNGRPSKSLSFTQAEAVLAASERASLHAYIVVALLTGARMEELRALTWDHVDLVGDLKAVPVIPPYIAVWRSVRTGGDTKTKKSRRTLALLVRCVQALLAGERPRLRLGDRDRAGRGERTAGLPAGPQEREGDQRG